ncbi:MAG: hypothetical protein ABI949_10130, partial [Ilumatobacteraceae bacterium]
MRPSRQDVVDLLQREADTPTPAIDAVFVEQLARRLRALDLGPIVPPRRRRIGRASFIAIVAVTATAGAAGAAAGVISWRTSPETPAVTKPISTAQPTIELPSSSSTPRVITAETTSPATVVESTTLAPTATVTVETTAPTTTPTPPPTVPPPSTEVRVAATLALTCRPSTAAISCTWDSGPAGTTHYAVLRTDDAGGRGRVFTPEPGSTTYV